MEQKEKVSGTQFEMLMFVFVTSTIIIYVPGFTAIEAKESAWLAASILPFIFGALTLWVVYKLGSYFPQLTIFQYCEGILGGFFGKCLEILYLIFLVVMDALVLREFSDFIVITTLPLTPKTCLLTCISLLATYGAYKGLEVIARAVQFIISIYLLGFIAVLLLALTNFEMGRLLPVMEDGVWPIVRGSLAPASWYGEICLITILFPFVNKPKELKRKGLITLTAIALFLTLDVVVTIGVLGSNLTSMVTLPFWAVTRSIEIGEVVQRLESFFMVIWITGIIIKATLLSYLIGLGITQVFGLKNLKLVLGVVAVSEQFICLNIGNATQVSVILQSYWPPFAIVFELIIPTVLLSIRWLRKKPLGG
ncbi:endospore germination permease [Desulfosporosinus sp. SB140]|uniref:GerAB/ArcD/ProY family transporter n=1 Tax=Desulfosporosinus paludis TaxID=3115649 RepID=UPI00388D26BD